MEERTRRLGRGRIGRWTGRGTAEGGEERYCWGGGGSGGVEGMLRTETRFDWRRGLDDESSHGRGRIVKRKRICSMDQSLYQRY